MQFGDYELLQEIGRGGQGVVYRARQRSLNRSVALKVIGLGQWASAAHLKRFRQEAEAAAQLEHPQIVPIYEIGEYEGSCFFSMKLIEGGQLDRVVRPGPMTPRAAAELLVKVARTVQFAHDRGILHRDIKPGNILLDPNGTPHLTDFGLARLVERESTVTNSFDVMGTPSFMAPEQAAGLTKQLSVASDVYGLGAVFYQLLTGQPPFAGGTTYETIRMVLESDPRPPRLWNPKVNRELATICLTCLEKDPARRYASAAALADDVERWLRHEPIRARPSGAILRARKWLRRNPMTATAGVCAIALIATIGFVISRSDLVRPAPTTGVAVLPFANLSADQANAYFAEGIQDEILSRLSKISSLRVVSRNSTQQYGAQPRNLPQLARELGVANVLEGTVQRVANRTRINVELIRATTREHVWAETYDSEAADVLGVEGQVATSVANVLKARLTNTEQYFLEEKPTSNPQAYDEFLRGLAYALRPHPGNSDNDTLTALEHFEVAVRLDPNFATAWTWITRVSSLGYFNMVGNDPTVLREKARHAMANVQRLAPNPAETLMAQGFFQYYCEERYDTAIAAFERAVALIPGSSEPLDALALVCRRKSQWEKSRRSFRRAIELDPRNILVLSDYADTLCELRDYSSALRIYDRILEMTPRDADAIASEASIYQAKGDLAAASKLVAQLPPASNSEVWYRSVIWQMIYERRFSEAALLLEDALRRPVQPLPEDVRAQYREWLAEVKEWSGDAAGARVTWEQARNESEAFLRAKITQPCYANPRTWLAEACAGLGDKPKAREMAALIVDKGDGDQLEIARLATARARIRVACGDRDLALEQLEVAAQNPGVAEAIDYGDLRMNPRWDPLRGDARFEKIVAALAPKN